LRRGLSKIDEATRLLGVGGGRFPPLSWTVGPWSVQKAFFFVLVIQQVRAELCGVGLFFLFHSFVLNTGQIPRFAPSLQQQQQKLFVRVVFFYKDW
jgi:hypothetical protein